MVITLLPTYNSNEIISRVTRFHVALDGAVHSFQFLVPFSTPRQLSTFFRLTLFREFRFGGSLQNIKTVTKMSNNIQALSLILDSFLKIAMPDYRIWKNINAKRAYFVFSWPILPKRLQVGSLFHRHPSSQSLRTRFYSWKMNIIRNYARHRSQTRWCALKYP